MRIFLTLAGLVAIVVAMNGAGGAAAVTYLGHEKVAQALAKNGDLVKAQDLTVLGAFRNGPGQVEVHDKETDVFYVTDGSASFVTGGTMIGGKASGPGQMRGTDIQGGQVHHLTKGDVIVIPAGTPHWFREVPASINYFVVKVLK